MGNPEGTQVPMLDECSVRKYLTQLKQTSPGPDNFPYWFWRDYAHHLAPVITRIFNCSLKWQVVPLAWKLANVSPIPTASTISSCNQLRPMLLTSTIKRLYERFVCKQELTTITKTSFGSDQYAYTKGKTTLWL